MPIIDSNGRELTISEIKQLSEVIKAQYENLKLQIKKTDSEELANQACAEYDKRIAAIENDYLAKMNSKETISMDSILYNEIRTTTKDVLNKCVDIKRFAKIDANFGQASAEDRDYYSTVSDFFYYAFNDMGDPEIKKMVAPSEAKNYNEPENKPDAFEKTTETFEFAKEPLEGIEDIIPYNPNSDSTAGILEQRAGNSTTLKWTAEKVKNEQAILQSDLDAGKIDKAAYDKKMADIDAKVKAREQSLFSFSSAGNLTRMIASELMNMSSVSGFDVFNMFSEINKFVNMDNKSNPNPGTLRGKGVAAGSIIGVGIANVAQDMFKTCQMISDAINDIKAETDPAMQKTHAIQLAGFAYQLTLSEHLFADGNGRSCRMLSDAILESFGLPPHIPTPEEQTIAATIGEPLDYKKGTEVFYNGVKLSSDALKQLNKDNPDKKLSSGKAVQGKARKKINVTEKLVNDIKKLNENAKKAKGTFRDSEQYKKFLKGLDITESIASAIKEATEKGTNINKDNLSKEAKRLVNALYGEKDFTVKSAQRILDKSLEFTHQSAKDYVEYKLRDHTLDPKAEPNKKALNSDDIAKLNVMKVVLGKNLGTGKEIKLPEKAAPAEVKEQENPFVLG